MKSVICQDPRLLKFLEPRLSPKNIASYIPRHSILGALRSQLPNFSGTILDVGCGIKPYRPLLLSLPSGGKRYIGLDLADQGFDLPDVVWDGISIPLATESVDCALATEVLEHSPQPETILREIARVLAPRGFLFLTVPFLFPLHHVPHDQHRITPFAMQRYLEENGFEDIRLQALGGWDASMAQLLGLWADNRPQRWIIKRFLTIIAIPAMRLLIKSDTAPDTFDDHCMITHLAATARKAITRQDKVEAITDGPTKER